MNVGWCVVWFAEWPVLHIIEVERHIKKVNLLQVCLDRDTQSMRFEQLYDVLVHSLQVFTV